MRLVVAGEATTVAVITGLTLLDTGAVTALLCFTGDNCELGTVLVRGDLFVTRDEVEAGVGVGATGEGLGANLATDSPTDFRVLTKVSAIPMREGTCNGGMVDNLSVGVVFSGRGVAIKLGSVEDASDVLRNSLISLDKGLWGKYVCVCEGGGGHLHVCYVKIQRVKF